MVVGSLIQEFLTEKKKIIDNYISIRETDDLFSFSKKDIFLRKPSVTFAAN